jgi:hypothetical protein
MRAPIDTRSILGEAKDKKRLDTGPSDCTRQLANFYYFPHQLS